MNGLIHIYTGDGKGKTTSSIGLLVRALGSGMNVYFTQFLKNRDSSEFHILDLLATNNLNANKIGKLTFGKYITINKFTVNMSKNELDDTAKLITNQFNECLAELITGKFDMVIFDEIIAAITTNLLPRELVIDFLKSKPQNLEVILTGRNAPDELIQLASYVSKIDNVKHPYKDGIQARKGIEF